MTAEALAAGEQLFHIDLQKDCTTPYQAPLVQYGVSPGNLATQSRRPARTFSTRMRAPRFLRLSSRPR
jgi:hypothetical protein